MSSYLPPGFSSSGLRLCNLRLHNRQRRRRDFNAQCFSKSSIYFLLFFFLSLCVSCFSQCQCTSALTTFYFPSQCRSTRHPASLCAKKKKNAGCRLVGEKKKNVPSMTHLRREAARLAVSETQRRRRWAIFTSTATLKSRNNAWSESTP